MRAALIAEGKSDRGLVDVLARLCLHAWLRAGEDIDR
ncbi:hypothetical protein ENSA7_34410 [Enhygromyxa salina]|uniref:Uncharacterized protein n=1 Tax=Enhygromyxa salina TaxID=215803 RepID=A0A2S9YP79_9BACT|nr:hypothetical protein ENSA7_34410 [Enhygromyxa salina]